MPESSKGKGKRRRAGPRAKVERSAGGVVTRRIDGDVHILLIRDPYRNLGLPKGHLEKGEAAVDAALREVTEETGLDALEVGPELATIDWYFRLRGRLVHKYCAFYLMHSPEGDPVPEMDEGITECIWVPMDDAITRIAYDNARSVVEAAVQRIRAGEDFPFEL